jgi:shikimate dehydrogenase
MERLAVNTKINSVNCDTKIFFSISNNPSTRGSLFYNKLFKYKNYIYLPIKIKNKIIFKKIIKFLKKNIINFAGASISMPYKEEILKYTDIKHYTVKKSQNANTIIYKNSKLKAFNTDYLAAQQVLKKNNFNNIILIGAGALSKTFLSLAKGKKVYIYNRSKIRLKKIKMHFYKINNLEIKKINQFVLINTTPIIKNIKLYDDINFNNAILIIDCALSNKSTILERLANKYSLNYISGNDFYKLQRNFQKKIYLNGGL